MQRSATSVPRVSVEVRGVARRPTLTVAWLVVALCVFQGAAARSAQAQETVGLGGVEVGGTAYHTFVRSGEVRIEVLALGSVRSPGIYAVGLGMTLDQLLALTGGASVSTRSSEERIRVMVRLYRQEAGQRRLIYEKPLERMLTGTEQYPVLQDGDALMVETIVRQQWFTLERALRFLSTAGTLFLVILRIVDASN